METTGLNFRTIPDPFGSFIKSIPPEEIVDVDQPGDPKPKLGIEVGAAREAREAEAVKKRQQREALERQRKEKETQEREKEAKAKEAKEKEASERAAREKEKKDRERREKEAMERLKQSR